ncbi:MAG TPA: pilus assembly protein TadG-related protein [Gaiellaceae bacterium]|jgi:hypothetical protein|nr:pilus assembly protein TadG-related protein [Gaiellaceae bacterium]
MTSFRRDDGQVAVLSVVFLTVLLGMSALVLDVGTWFRADRAAQATADAAALAAAQALPDDPSKATALAHEYAGKNSQPKQSVAVELKTTLKSSDTVRVTVEAPAPGVFARLFGIDSVTVRATATARTGGPAQAKWVAPIVVDEKHPMLNCTPQPCFGQATSLDYQHLKANGSPDGSGSFGFINLLKGSNNPGTSELGSWIEHGFDRYMDLGLYNARTGNPFSSSHVEYALKARFGEELLFPIYRTLASTGSNAQYEIVGWVGFHVTGVDFKGNDERILGHFTSVVWEGLQATTATSGSPGVKIIALVD